MTTGPNLQVRRARRSDRVPLRNMLELYQHDQYSDQYSDQYVKGGDWKGFVQCFDNRAYTAEAGALHSATDDAHCAD